MKSHLEEGGGGEGATDENGRRLNNTEDSTIITLKQDTDAEMGEEVILPNVVTVVSDSGV